MNSRLLDHLGGFRRVATPPEGLITSYADRLPPVLLGLWRTYGFGSCMSGYLKIVNPSEYAEVYQAGFEGGDDEVAFAVTAFGDCFGWVGDAVRMLDFRHGTASIVNGDNLERFFVRRLADLSFLTAALRSDHHAKACRLLGEPAFDECFGYVPALALGGSEDVDKLRHVKTVPHIELLTQIAGPCRFVSC